MKTLLILGVSFLSFCLPKAYSDSWYGVVGSGYACTLEAGIDNPDPSFWDFANEGYDDNLGGSPFFEIGFGRTFCCMYDFDITYSYYQTFHYQKYQTGAGATPGFTGNARTRYFDLDHQNLMFDATIDPVWECLNWRLWCLNVRPVIGAGIGVGFNRITNFHTVGFDDDADVGSTTSIGGPHTTASFAWRVFGALRLTLTQCLNFDIGYRYYDGGRFQGPSSFVANTETFSGALVDGPAWKGRLKANEIYLRLNYGF